MRIVVRIGGSVIASPINPALVSEYIDTLIKLEKQEHKVAVVVGGGVPAREFIEITKSLGLEERFQDEVAISVSRILAQILLKKLGRSGCESVPLTIDGALRCLQRGKITVMGGLKPGMTTDTVAALIAEQIDADLLIKATDQEGVYDKDPRKHVDAVKLDNLSFDDLLQVFTEEEHRAGIHQVLDPTAVRILRKGRTKVIIVNGFKPENVLAAIGGEKVGTLIS